MIIGPSEALQFVDAIAADRATLARIRAALAEEGYDDTDPVRGVDNALADALAESPAVDLSPVWASVDRLVEPVAGTHSLADTLRRAVDAIAAACPGDGPIVDRVVAALKGARVVDGVMRAYGDDLSAIGRALDAVEAPDAATLAERVRALVAERDAERDKARATYAAATEEVARLRVEAGNARERAYAAERERDNVRAKASAERATPRDGDRFVVDKRTGIVAIYDTDHPKYERPAGCHSDFPWTVCHWSGDPRDDRWVMRPDYVAAAERVCALLNDLDAKARP